MDRVVFDEKRHVSHGDRAAAIFASLEDHRHDRRTPIRRAPLLAPGQQAQTQQKSVASPGYSEFWIFLSRQCTQLHDHMRNPIVPASLITALKVLSQERLEAD
jgi:hypothetical protein